MANNRNQKNRNVDIEKGIYNEEIGENFIKGNYIYFGGIRISFKFIRNLVIHSLVGVVIGLMTITVSVFIQSFVLNPNITSRIGEVFGAILISAYCKSISNNRNTFWSLFGFTIVAFFASMLVRGLIESFFHLNPSQQANNVISYTMSYAAICAIFASVLGSKNRT